MIIMSVDSTTTTSHESLQQEIFEVTRCIYGNWVSCVTYVFAELGIADVLKSGPKDIDHIANACEVKANYLRRMLRCAFEMGFLKFDKNTGLYTITPKGSLLSSDHPYTKREEARLNGAAYRYHPWGNLLNILRHGMSEEYSPTYKSGSIDYLRDKQDWLNTFHTALEIKSKSEDYGLIKDYDFSPYSKVLDLGSGYGSLVRCILDHNEHLKGYLFEVDDFEYRDVEPAYEGRLFNLHGDFFEEIPDCADLYIMKNVIHNWPEDKAKLLMEKTRDAMHSTNGIGTDPAKKRLLIIENIVPENDDPKVANWMDLNFMILVDGAERTLEEYRILGAECGLRLVNAYETAAKRHIVEYELA